MEVPKAPRVRRKARVWPFQFLGLLLVFGIPILALFNVLGDSTKEFHQRASVADITAEFPDRLRYGVNAILQLKIKNTSEFPLDFKVSFDPSYMTSFSEIQFIPEVDENLTVLFGQVEPKDTRLVTMEFKGKRYGENKGRITVYAGDASIAEVDSETYTFP